MHKHGANTRLLLSSVWKHVIINALSHFFNYYRLASVTDMLSELNLPKFDVLFNNSILYLQIQLAMAYMTVLMVLSDILSFTLSFIVSS